MTVTKRFLLLLGVVLCCAAVAMAQVEAYNGVFQLEGDATKTTTICFLQPASGGPAIATPGTPTATNGLDANGCPTVSNVGSPHGRLEYFLVQRRKVHDLRSCAVPARLRRGRGK